MKRRYYFMIALCSYLFFALASTPAAKVIALAKENMKIPAQFYGVQGSIWNGSADSVKIQTHTIEQLQWSINPAALLVANISADVQGSIKNQNIVGNVSVNMSGEVQAEDLRARLNAKDVQEIMALPLGELAGIINVNVESLNWTGEGLPETRASIKWQRAKLTLLDTIDLGEVLVDIKPDENNGLLIAVNNTGGALEINGTVELNDKKNYKLKADFKPSASADDNIKQSLAMFAKRQSTGVYQFKHNGNLNNIKL